MISVPDAGLAGARGDLCGFREEFYRCLPRRADALFELAEAALCADGAVRSLVELSLVGEHRRGHGSLYAALAQGRCDTGRLRKALAGLPLPRAADGRLVLAVDITCWLRPEVHTLGAADLVPYLWAGQGPAHHDPRVAVFGDLRAGTRPVFVDRAAGRPPAGARGRRCSGHCGAGAAGGDRPDGRGAVAARTSWSCSMRAMTRPGWRICWRTCRWRCWAGCARTGSCAVRPDLPRRALGGGRAATMVSSPSATRPPEGHRR
jgi:DDE superfamily endonuclease